MLAAWSLVPVPFLNPVCKSGSSWFTYCWRLVWRILSITFLICEMSTILWKHSLALPFFGIGMETDRFQSCGPCWVLHICRYIEYSILTATSFSIWNTSAGISPSLLALFAIMLPKAHLTSPSRMPGSRWVTTPLYSSGSLRPFLYSSVYSCHLNLFC